MSSLACLAHAEAYTSLVVGVLLKGFWLAHTCQDKILETFILYHIPSTFFCFFSLASASRSSFTPQELLVNLTRIPLLSLLSFSRMLLDWQGPALHALSFWLQAPPTSPPSAHTLTHKTLPCCMVTGQVQIFFFSLFSSDSCGLGLPWQRLPEELMSGGVVGQPTYFFF